MSSDKEFITKEDHDREMERLRNEMLSHYATKAKLSDLRAEFYRAAIWLVPIVASIATSAAVSIERLTG